MLAIIMHQAARRGGVHVFGVYYRKLGAGAAAPTREVTCRRLRDEEVLSLCADAELDLHETMVRAALLKGHACVGAFCEGRLAGYVWFAYEDAPHLNGVRVSIPARAIYRFKAFVRPAFRGHGVARFLYGAADGIVARPGREHVVSCIAVQNRPSVAASIRSGDELLGYLGYWQAGKRFLVLHTRAVEAFGLRFYLSSGNHAPDAPRDPAGAGAALAQERQGIAPGEKVVDLGRARERPEPSRGA